MTLPVVQCNTAALHD